jgi:hypothetical protein
MSYKIPTRTEFDYEIYPPTEVSRPTVLYPVVGRKWPSQPGTNQNIYKMILPTGRVGLLHRTKAGVSGGTDWVVYVRGKIPKCSKLLWLMELGPGWIDYYQVWMVYVHLYTSYNTYRIGYQVNTVVSGFWYYPSSGTWTSCPVGYGSGVTGLDIRVGQELDLSTGKITAFHVNERRYEQASPPSMYVEAGGDHRWSVIVDLYLRTSTDGYQHSMLWGPHVFYPLE